MVFRVLFQQTNKQTFTVTTPGTATISQYWVNKTKKGKNGCAGWNVGDPLRG